MKKIIAIPKSKLSSSAEISVKPPFFITKNLKFNSILNPNWKTGLENWNANEANMLAKNIKYKNSELEIKVNKESSIKNNIKYNYTGGEVQSKNKYNNGKFTFYIKNGAKSGTVGSAFLISPWKKDYWHQQEIDIEFLGDKPYGVQFNLISQKHTPSTIIDETQNKLHKFINLDFDTRDGYHKYSIEKNKHSHKKRNNFLCR